MIYVVWGSTFFFIGQAMSGMPPYLLGALRFSIAGALMLGLAKLSGEQIWHGKLVLSSWLCGALLLFADMLAIMLAQRYISSSMEAVLAASTLIWITLLDVPMWRQHLRRPRVLLGVLGGMGGVLLLYWGHIQEQGDAAARGMLIFLGGTLAWSLGSLFSKYKVSGYESVNAWSGTGWQMLAAGALFWLCSGCSGEVAAVQWGSITLRSWVMLGYLIVFGSMLAYSSYVWLLKIRPATEVGTHAYANPFIAIILGACFGGEVITLSQWLGLSVILICIFLINKRKEQYVNKADRAC